MKRIKFGLVKVEGVGSATNWGSEEAIAIYYFDADGRFTFNWVRTVGEVVDCPFDIIGQ